MKLMYRHFVAFLILLALSKNALAGYDLHVTRKEYWADKGGAVITYTEWQSYVQRDGAIQKDSQNSEYDFIVMTNGDSFPIWYNPRLGELSTKNPSDVAIEKLKQIANELKAKVQGDDGELYP